MHEPLTITADRIAARRRLSRFAQGATAKAVYGEGARPYPQTLRADLMLVLQDPAAHSPAEWVDFNVNHYFRVRLRERGLKILRDRHDQIYARLPGAPAWTPPKTEDGWVKMQAWCVMQDFGPHIGMGRDAPFETTIQIEQPAHSSEAPSTSQDGQGPVRALSATDGE